MLAQNGPPVLLDVRTTEEFRRARLAGALHIPLQELPARLGELDPAKPVVVYCLSGGRSAQACMFLARQGFRTLHNLAGGIAGWARSGLPIDE
jgi:rhodanese-related sulfurtransferase